MVDYPDNFYSPREKENWPGVEYDPEKRPIFFNEDVESLEQEILAIETEMGLKPRSRARAYRAASTQTVLTGAVTKVQLDAESYDNLGEFDPVTNFRFTAQKAGYYQVSAVITYATLTAYKKYYAIIRKNGADYGSVIGNSAETSHFSIPVSDIVYLAANDYIELFTYHTTGSDQTILYGSQYTFLAIHKLSPA